MNSIKII